MTHIPDIKAKILSARTLISKVNYWKDNNKTIVFTNGCFDILHRGHVEYLSKAANCGDVLIIGLNSDASVKRIKGNNRPINDQNARAVLLAALACVDAVVYFEEDTPYNLINLIKPHVLIKGKDYKAKDIVGYDILKKYKGKIKTIKLVEGYSTTAIEKKIQKNIQN